MSPEEKEAVLRIIEAIGSLTLGATLAVLITHRLTIARERINGINQRRRAFLAFLEGWRYEISRLYLAVGGVERRDSAFSDSISAFVQEASIIKWDFKSDRRKEFERLCSAITDARHPTVYNKEAHEKVVESLNKIIVFVAGC